MRFFGSFLILTLALFLQFYFGDSTGIWINFALAALITATFFLDFLEIVLLTLFAVLVLNWQPALSLELAVFSLVPIAVFAFGKRMPFLPWLGNLAMIFLGLCLFYLFTDFRFIFQHFNLFAADLSLATLFGILAYGSEGAALQRRR